MLMFDNAVNLVKYYFFISDTVYFVTDKGTPSLAGRSLFPNSQHDCLEIHPLRSA